MVWVPLTFSIVFQAFIAGDITFAMKPYFRGPFCCHDVREGLVVAFLRHITTVCMVRDQGIYLHYCKTDKLINYFGFFSHHYGRL